MKVKDGDIVEFLAISWNENHWDFDYPTVILSPVIRYSPNGTDPETMLEDLGIDMLLEDVQDENITTEFEGRGWKLETLKRVAKNRLAGKDDWKSKIREVLHQKVKFRFNTKSNEMEFDVIESITK